MKKIYLHSPWKDDEEFLDSIRKQTPNESRSWGELVAVTEPEKTDYHIAFNEAADFLDRDRLIVLPMEPPWYYSRNMSIDNIDALRTYSINDIYKPQHWWVSKNYDYLLNSSPTSKKDKISWVTSDKGKRVNSLYLFLRKLIMNNGLERYKQLIPFMNRGPSDGHILRMDFLDRIVDVNPELIDLYGKGDFSSPCYRGVVEDKWSGLAPYKYSLAIENYKGKNYFTEKITDALLSWCMPIYWGCTNLTDFLPENSYIWIDIEDPSAPEKLSRILGSNLWRQNLDAIAEARQRILNKYQIWPTIENVI